AYLAAVIRGNPSRELRTTLDETIESIHVLQGSALANFQGKAAVFEPLRPELEACLRTQYTTATSGRRPIRAWLTLGTAVVVAIFGLAWFAQSKSRWKNFLLQLNAQPGLVVTDARQGWFSSSQV